MWKVFALLSAVFAAATAILAKVGVKEINSNLATSIRTTVILVITWLIVLFGGNVKSNMAAITPRTLTFLILSGVATGLSWLCYFRAIQLGPVSKVAPIDKLSVVFVIILSALFLGESLDVKTIVGGALITAGAIVMIL